MRSLLRTDYTHLVVGKYIIDTWLGCPSGHRSQKSRLVTRSIDIVCAARLSHTPERSLTQCNDYRCVDHCCFNISMAHTSVLLHSSNLIKTPSPPHQITHPTSYHPSPVPGSHAADHIRPSSQQSALSLRYHPRHGLYHRRIGRYWSILQML